MEPAVNDRPHIPVLRAQARYFGQIIGDCARLPLKSLVAPMVFLKLRLSHAKSRLAPYCGAGTSNTEDAALSSTTAILGFGFETAFEACAESCSGDGTN